MYYGEHEFDNGGLEDPKEGKCIVEDFNRFHQKMMPCGRLWYSAVHPPDQFRHWCSALEAGGDCMHFEDF